MPPRSHTVCRRSHRLTPPLFSPPIFFPQLPFFEGQSFGVIPPGTKINAKGKEVPHSVRLYSIASTRYGEGFDGKTATLCVRRAVYFDAELGKEDPAKKGICSNFLCDSKPGDKITMTGPTGTVMLLPEENPNAVHIMCATGTGIAPFRTYLRRMFVERPPTFQFTGLAWLFMGVANSDAKLYDDEFSLILKEFPEQVRARGKRGRGEGDRRRGMCGWRVRGAPLPP